MSTYNSAFGTKYYFHPWCELPLKQLHNHWTLYAHNTLTSWLLEISCIAHEELWERASIKNHACGTVFWSKQSMIVGLINVRLGERDLIFSAEFKKFSKKWPKLCDTVRDFISAIFCQSCQWEEVFNKLDTKNVDINGHVIYGHYERIKSYVSITCVTLKPWADRIFITGYKSSSNKDRFLSQTVLVVLCYKRTPGA